MHHEISTIEALTAALLAGDVDAAVAAVWMAK